MNTDRDLTDGDGAQLLEDLMRFKPEGLTPNAWAVSAGVSRAIWADLQRHGNPSRRTLSKLLGAVGSSLAEFEALRVEALPGPGDPWAAGVADADPPAWRSAPLAPVPLLEMRTAGEWRRTGSNIELAELFPQSVRGHVARPATLAGDRGAYAVEMPGGAMWPRFRPLRRLIVSPAAPVAIGDDVLVQLQGRAGDGSVNVLIREMVERAADFVELRQFTPDMVFRVVTADIAAIHKVMGEAI